MPSGSMRFRFRVAGIPTQYTRDHWERALHDAVTQFPLTQVDSRPIENGREFDYDLISDAKKVDMYPVFHAMDKIKREALKESTIVIEWEIVPTPTN